MFWGAMLWWATPESRDREMRERKFDDASATGPNF
jgi:hypothetical protein